MIGALWNGTMGLSVFDSAIGVESSNSSNTTTVAHKADELRFQDLLYTGSGFGKGVQVDTISKNFTQGETEFTNVSTDVAIEGKGFFIVQDRISGETYYTRAGNFQKSGDGYLETQANQLVFGLAPQERQYIRTDLNDDMFTTNYTNNIVSINIEDAEKLYNINVKTTDYKKDATDVGVSGDNFKTASTVVKNVELLIADYNDKLKLYQSNPQAASQDIYNNSITVVDYSSVADQFTNNNDQISLSINGITYTQEYTTNVSTTLDLLAKKISYNETMNVDQIGNSLVLEDFDLGNSTLTSSVSLNSISSDISDIAKYDFEADNGATVLDFTSYENQLDNTGEELSVSFGNITYKQEFDTNLENTLSLLASKITAGEGVPVSTDKISGALVLENYMAADNFLTTSASIDSQTQITQVNYSSLLSELQDQNDFLSLTINNNVYRQNAILDSNNNIDLEETLRQFSDKLSNVQGFDASIDTLNGILTVENIVPGKAFTVTSATINDQFIPINTLQEANLGFGNLMIEASRDTLKESIELANAKYLEITNVLSDPKNALLSEATAINLGLDFNNLVEDGFGRLKIENDGLVYLVDTDGNNYLISKIQTAHFINEQGLNPIGGNLFMATEESGLALNADALNNVASNTLEKANVNYSDSLSSLMVYQKAFEANSKSITIADEFLKTAIDMKK